MKTPHDFSLAVHLLLNQHHHCPRDPSGASVCVCVCVGGGGGGGAVSVGAWPVVCMHVSKIQKGRNLKLYK